jgi:hypothetical protein
MWDDGWSGAQAACEDWRKRWLRVKGYACKMFVSEVLVGERGVCSWLLFLESMAKPKSIEEK